MKKPTKLLMGFIGFLVLFVVLALVIPFLIDFNHFKPQIQKAVSDNVNASIDFQSIRLQIIPGLGFKVVGVKLENTDPVFKGTKLLSVDEIFFEAELMPLLQKKFRGELFIDKPEFVMAKDGMKNNLAALAKPKAADAPAPKDSGKKDPKEQEDLFKMIKEDVLLKSLTITKANLKIIDISGDKTAQPIQIKDFNLVMTDIGLERDIKTLITTSTVVDEGGARVSGPIKISLVTNAKVGANGLELAKFSGDLNFDKLNINFRNAFVKTSDQIMNVAFTGNVTSNSFSLEKMNFNLHNLQVAATAHISDLKSLQTKANVDLSNSDLAKLGDLLPQHKNLLTNASVKLNATVNGPISDFKRVAATVDFATVLTGSDFSTKVNVASLEPMVVQIGANSSRLDLDAILKPFLPPEGSEATKTQAPQPGQKPETPEKEFELSDAQRKLLGGSDIRLDVSLKQIIFKQVKVDNLIVKSQVNGLNAALSPFSLDIFGGNMKVTGQVDLGAKPIAFQNSFNLTDIHPEEAIAVIKPEHKDVLKGKMSIALTASGKGTTKTSITQSLNGKGEFLVKEGELKSGSIAALMQQEFDKFVGGLSITSVGDGAFKQAEQVLNNPLVKKIPGANTNGFDLNKYKEQYATITKVSIAEKATKEKTLKDVKGVFEIKEGRIYITSKNPSPAGNLELNSSVGLDLTLGGKAAFTASDSTKSKMIQQSQYASLLFDQQKNLVINMQLGGTVSEPSVVLDLAAIRANFSANAKALAEKEVKQGAEQYIGKFLGGQKDALQAELKKKEADARANADAARKKAEDEIRKRAEEEAKKRGGEAAKDKLKGLFGK